MNPQDEDQVLSEHTIKTLQGIVEEKGGCFDDGIISSIQFLCKITLRGLNDYYKDLAGVLRLIRVYKKLPGEDRVRIAHNIESAYGNPHKPGKCADTDTSAPDKLIEAIKLDGFGFLPETNGTKPPSIKKQERGFLFCWMYDLYVDLINLEPTETEGGTFWEFMKNITTDPSMEGSFDLKSVSDEIDKARKEYLKNK